MTPPVAAEFETRFLVTLQRLLGEGSFVATYKYALLLALADISVERGQDTGDTLAISTEQIAEKFILYYWRQIVPYPGAVGEPVVLAQNTGTQAEVVSKLRDSHLKHGGSLTKTKQGRDWPRLVRAVATVVRKMPLWRLQTIGSETVDFLYDNTREGDTVVLKPGVMFCFRKYHPLISELAKGGWARYVRRFNPVALGSASDLHEFLFGTERASLNDFVPILLKAQNECCFYCERRLVRGAVAVDHFVPWSRYPVDLGHNFVLAHGTCNGAKSDYLAAEEHLKRWVQFQKANALFLTQQFEERGIVATLSVSNQVVRWAYHQTCAVQGLAWVRGKEFKKVDPTWSECLGALLN